MTDLSSLGSLYHYVKARLCEIGSDNPEYEARLILEKRTGASHAVLISEPKRFVGVAEQALIQKDLRLRGEGKPIHRIFGERDFWGLSFKVNSHTLEPRPDTETLIEAALKIYGKSPPATILDLGTGSGCILISLLKEWPDSQGVGVDLSYEAVAIARENARAHEVDQRARFISGSWGDALGARFDLIVSNPPYIEREAIASLQGSVRDHDPILALDGGEDGLSAYRQIFFSFSGLISVGGRGLFEIGFDQEESVVRLAEKYGCSVRFVYHDLAGWARVVEISCGDK